MVTSTPHLDWFCGGPDGLSGLDHYDVYRGGVKIGQCGLPSFDDAGIAVDGIYVYTVKAVDAAGNASAASNATTSCATTPPERAPDDRRDDADPDAAAMTWAVHRRLRLGMSATTSTATAA